MDLTGSSGWALLNVDLKTTTKNSPFLQTLFDSHYLLVSCGKQVAPLFCSLCGSSKKQTA
jgi:hypothetical protein